MNIDKYTHKYNFIESISNYLYYPNRLISFIASFGFKLFF